MLLEYKHIYIIMFVYILLAGCSSAYACFDANGGSLKEIRNRKVCHRGL